MNSGSFSDFLQALLTLESGIDPAKFAWYLEYYDLPEVHYQRVSAPGRLLRDQQTGVGLLGPMTVRQYFETLGVADRFDPESPDCLREMQYAAMNPLGFVGYQLGEAILITTGHYVAERDRRDVGGTAQEFERYYSRLAGDDTWRNGCREAFFRIPGSSTDILATDVNTWRGQFTGRDGVHCLDDLKSPSLQNKVLRCILESNHQLIHAELASLGQAFPVAGAWPRRFERPDGTSVEVVPTMSGLLAAAHLCGVHATIQFLRAGTLSADEFDTSILDYIVRFSGYDTPFPSPTARSRLNTAMVAANRLKTPLFSIVLPTYNRNTMLPRAVASVRRQSLEDYELIVVDDGSVTPCDAWLASLRDPRIRLIRNRRNGGVSVARNQGIAAARGRYVAFLDDDDEYRETYLASTFDRLEHTPDEVGICWCSVTRLEYPSHPGGPPRPVERLFATDYASQTALFEAFLSIGTGFGVAIKSDCLRAVGPFNPGLRTAEDTDLFLRILATGYVPTVVPGSHIVIHDHHESRVTGMDMHAIRIRDCESVLLAHADFFCRQPSLRTQLQNWMDHLRGELAATSAPIDDRIIAIDPAAG